MHRSRFLLGVSSICIKDSPSSVSRSHYPLKIITREESQLIIKIGETLNFKHVDDWYKLTATDVSRFGGKALLKQFDYSIISMLKNIFPHIEWLPWKFGSVQYDFWKKRENVSNYLNWLGKELKYESIEDWYKVKLSDFRKNHGESLVDHHKTPLTILRFGYNQVNWEPWKFNQTEKFFWDKRENCTSFLDSIANQQKLVVTSESDWYKIDSSFVSQYYKGHVIDLLKSAYPYYDWLPWKFEVAPRKFWGSTNNQRWYLEWLFKQLGYTEIQDWYKIRANDLLNHHGRGLLKRYDSIPSLIETVYPEHQWLPWKFSRVPKNYWSSLSNQARYINWLYNQLGFKDVSDWYNVQFSTFEKNNGIGLLNRYERSFYKLLQSVYPNFEWKPWHFTRIPSSSLGDLHKSKEVYHQFIEELSKQLQINHSEDWYRVSLEQVTRFGGKPIIKNAGNFANVLSQVYPNHTWDSKRFQSRIKKAGQRILKLRVSELFISQDGILEDYVHPDLSLPSGDKLQLDVFVPSLKLAFEYQGQQHYQSLSFFGSVTNYKSRDKLKSQICEAAGIYLIAVPYWWDQKTTSLQRWISNVNPNIKFS